MVWIAPRRRGGEHLKKKHYTMDIGDIIGYVITAITSGGLVGVANWRINRRKAKAEAKQQEAEAKATEIENIKNTVQQVYQPIIEDLKGRLAEVENEIREVRAENIQLKRENVALRNELEEIRENATWRNTHRGKDGKYAKKEYDKEAKP